MNNKKDIYDQDVKKELEMLSEKLSGLNKTNPFSTPKDYFDELPLKIKKNCIAYAKNRF